MRIVDWFRPRHLHRVALWLVMLAASGAWAQVIQVEPTNKGFFASPLPTTTFLFEAADARGTLIFIPGGEGRVGMRPGMTANHGYFSAYHFNVMLRSLAELSGGARFNVVIFDSPVDLHNAQHWSGARTTAEHLSRVEDVIRHYRAQLGKPVWLMGHSLGSQRDRTLQAPERCRRRSLARGPDRQRRAERHVAALRGHAPSRAAAAS
jgi:pimeloyl-ACP methyl ester carboxylesterase